MKMKNVKKLLTLATMFAVSVSFAVTKKVGNGPIFLTINNKTSNGYLMDNPFTLIDLKSGTTGKAPLAAIKPKESMTLSGIEWHPGHSELSFDIMPLNSSATADAHIQLKLDENMDSATFNAVLNIRGQAQPKEIATIEIPRRQLRATSFVINVTLDGENLQNSDIDLTSGTSGAVKE